MGHQVLMYSQQRCRVRFFSFGDTPRALRIIYAPVLGSGAVWGAGGQLPQQSCITSCISNIQMIISQREKGNNLNKNEQKDTVPKKQG